MLEKFSKYIKNNLVALDQAVNALFFGDPDETLSSRMGKHQDVWICRWIAWGLSKIDKDHCNRAIEKDEGKDDLLI